MTDQGSDGRSRAGRGQSRVLEVEEEVQEVEEEGERWGRWAEEEERVEPSVQGRSRSWVEVAHLEYQEDPYLSYLPPS